jgi:predicted O-methyltransferase YrrM
MSFPALAQLIVDQRQYDFIYVDGSHNADDALADAVMCFGLLRPGGVMLFDDYLWEDGVSAYLSRPKQSIDAFVNMFYHRLKLGLVNYQLAIVKKELE